MRPLWRSETLSRVLQAALDRPPPGFRPGLTLRRALTELEPCFRVASLEGSRSRVVSRDGGFACDVREKAERHFLMHVVTLEIVLDVPAKAPAGAVLHLRNTGVVFRTGVACSVRKGEPTKLRPWQRRLEQDEALRAALLSLDFRRCQVAGSPSGWSVLLEPYGGSEVVSRYPSFRKYVRLGRDQVVALSAAVGAFRRLLAEPVDGRS